MQFRIIAVLVSLVVISGCTTTPIEPVLKFSVAQTEIYNIKQWAFDGRIAVRSKNDSWSATIDWNHDAYAENIKLSGPLGQGAVKVTLVGKKVTVDHGNGNVKTSYDADDFINKELGAVVPVQHLRYWAVGVPNPDQPYIAVADGFTQANWLCEYKEMIKVNNHLLPKKLMVTNGQIKLRLVIDYWNVEGRS